MQLVIQCINSTTKMGSIKAKQKQQGKSKDKQQTCNKNTITIQPKSIT